ncbi:MAG: TonB-dependent receptor, partial [Psychroflexus sp.]
GLHHSISSIERGELSLNPEQSYKFGVGFQGSFENLGFNIQPYANFINDYILMQPGDIERTIRGAFPVFEYSQTNARLLGVDVSANYKFQKIDFKTNFAYIHGEDLNENEALIDMPPTNWSNTIRYQFQKFQNLYLELNSQLVFEQNRFPDNNFDVEILNTETGDFEVETVDISTPPEAYHLLNFSSGMDFNLNDTKFNINLRINNLFNTKYRNYLNRQRYYADEIGTNVMLQLKVNY